MTASARQGHSEIGEPERAATALANDAADTSGRIESLLRDRDAILQSSESASTDDEHDPEGATLAFEREQLTALLDQAKAHLAELAIAAERFEAGSYGWCTVCGEAIPPERLAARPASITCVTCAARPASR